MSTNFYRVKPGGPIERLTQSPGTHTASMSPDGKLFLSSRSDIRTPGPHRPLRRRRQAGADDRLEPVARDEAATVRPARAVPDPGPRRLHARGRADPAADLEPGKKYPVWFTTYGGPHAPTVSDAWDGGRMRDHAMAARGFRHLPHGPAQRQRQGGGLGLDGVQAPGRPGDSKTSRTRSTGSSRSPMWTGRGSA